MSDKKYITMTEFAKTAKISRQAVHKMIKAGRLEAKKVMVKKMVYMIDRSALQKYLKEK